MLNLECVAFLFKRKGSLKIVRIQIFKRPLTTTGVENEGYRASRLQKRILRTLHPAMMVSRGQIPYEISTATRLLFSFRDENHPILIYLQKMKGRPSLPENTRGVLYYHTDPALPPIAGEVRFRLCDAVENFGRGSDLHILGVPWSLRLTRIAYTPNLIGLRKLLVKEGLVDNQMMSDISKFPNLDKLDDRLVLYKYSQPFHVDLTTTELRLNLVTTDGVQKVKFPNLFTDRRLGHSLSMYSGTMTARFELSHLPEHKISGPTLTLRFLECISEIETLVPGYEGCLLCPKPGHLLHRRPRLYLPHKVWSYPLNERCNGAALKDFIATTGDRWSARLP